MRGAPVTFWLPASTSRKGRPATMCSHAFFVSGRDSRVASKTKKLPNGSLLKTASESISRVLSLDDHLSRTRVTARLKHATRMHGRAAVWHSYLRLLQMGFSKPRCCQRAGALLPHRFSFSPACAGEFTFLWHFPSGRPAQPLAGILPCGARTFLAPLRGTRPSGPLACGIVAERAALLRIPQKGRRRSRFSAQLGSAVGLSGSPWKEEEK